MDAKLPLSVLLLARDEAGHLEALLPTLAFASEVVVVWDPRGNACTRQVAERLGARVFDHVFAGFGPQRQFALEQCTQPWVLWIDADERLGVGASARLAHFIAPGMEHAAIALHRVTHFLGAPIRHCGWQGETLVRVFRREGAQFDLAPVHERLGTPARTLVTSDLVLTHLSYETWEQCVDKPRVYAQLGAEKAFALGRRTGAFDMVWRPPLRFVRMYVLQLGVLDGVRGWLVCSLGAWQVFLKYAELWDRTRRARQGR
ncbi:MAG: glycosyltransferase family 2 protein [Candidatus Eisenbacteria bacterium]